MHFFVQEFKLITCIRFVLCVSYTYVMLAIFFILLRRFSIRFSFRVVIVVTTAQAENTR